MEKMSCILSYNNYDIDVVVFRKLLIPWGIKNFRLFPWRQTRDPYKILIAEVMLKRTQARQVLPVYNRFIDRYPTLMSIKDITLSELRMELKPLCDRQEKSDPLARKNLIHQRQEKSDPLRVKR